MNDMNNLQLSLFRGVHDTQPRPATLEELVAMIRTDQSVRDLTDKHRYALSTGDEQGAKRYKRMMTSFGVAARFEGGRQQKHIVQYTGLSLVDIDHIPPKDMERVLALVHGDGHTLLAYVTLSGSGLRIIFRYAVNKTTDYTDLSTDGSSTPHSNQISCQRAHVSLLTNAQRVQPSFNVVNQCNPSNPWLDNKEYRQVFEQGNEYYSNLVDMDYDHQCKNVGRISTIAYDENLYYNPEAVPFVITIEEKKPVGRPRRVESAKIRVESDHPAGHSHLSPANFQLVAKQVLAKVEADGIHYEPHHHNDYIARACYEMNRHGVPEEQCHQWAVQHFADYAATDDVPAIVRSCYQQTGEHGAYLKAKRGRRYVRATSPSA